MAGHGPTTVNMDPALVKYANMQMNRYKYFRWTARTARISFIYAVLVPSAFIYMAYTTEGKYDMRGKLRGNPIVEF